MKPRHGLLILCLLTLINVSSGSRSARADEQQDFFERRIRPVLVRHCHACHSAEADELAGELRLDIRSGWETGGESGQPAVIPGDPANSPLLKSIRHADDVSAMPPDQPRLADAVLKDFEVWIQSGAWDPRQETAADRAAVAERQQEFASRLSWWSLQPPTEPSIPSLENEDSIRTNVDRFLLERLQREQIQPAPEADWETLIRRLCLVLTGLPPQPELLQRYREQDPQQAWDRLVDELLESPAYGERWARHWMDVVHYTDTHGYEWDVPVKNAWRYRDYLIRAFNNDVPWNRLVQEQIAGDLLPPRVDSETGLNEALLGPLMLRLGERRHGDNSAIEGISQEAVSSMIDTLGKGFLGTTLACAQCHDHKLDAVRQQDYYSLAGMLMSTRFSARSLETTDRNAAQLQVLRALRRKIRQRLAEHWLSVTGSESAALETALQTLTEGQSAVGGVPAGLKEMAVALRTNSLSADQFQAERARRQQSNQQHVTVLADFASPTTSGGWQWDGAGMASGLAGPAEIVIAETGDSIVQHLLPAGRYSHLWSSKLPGLLQSPSFDSTAPITFSVEGVAGEKAAQSFIVDRALNPERMQFPSRPFPASQTFLAGRFDSLEGTRDERDRRVYFELSTKSLNNYFPPRVGYGGMQESDIDNASSWFGVSRVLQHPPGNPPLDELTRFEPLFAAAATASDWNRNLRSLLHRAVQRFQDDTCTADDARLLNDAIQLQLLPNLQTAIPAVKALVREYREQQQALLPDRTAGSVAEWNEGQDEPLAIRGSYTSTAAAVPRAQLSFLQPTAEFGSSSGRLQWAQRITSPDNPLTARVYVNRIWHHLFGNGLVRTPDDFGHLGESPTHPELLDWLTLQFTRQGWSTKRLIRQLVRSSAWRRSSLPVADSLQQDPENRLWHFWPVRRLEAEAIRDSLLATAGHLDSTLYGPPIEPFRTAEDSQKRLFKGPVDGAGRRSIYLEMTLMEPPRFLSLFNQPLPKLTVGRRDVTNVPEQALAMLNDPFVTEMARIWSERLCSGTETSASDRARLMLQRALGRRPQQSEIEDLVQLAEQSAALRGGPAALMQNQPAWQDAAHAVFNLKEFLYVR